jgi:hypothetical protein
MRAKKVQEEQEGEKKHNRQTYADVCWRMLTYADVCWNAEGLQMRAKKIQEEQERARERQRDDDKMREASYIYAYICDGLEYVAVLNMQR